MQQHREAVRTPSEILLQLIKHASKFRTFLTVACVAIGQAFLAIVAFALTDNDRQLPRRWTAGLHLLELPAYTWPRHFVKLGV